MPRWPRQPFGFMFNDLLRTRREQLLLSCFFTDFILGLQIKVGVLFLGIKHPYKRRNNQEIERYKEKENKENEKERERKKGTRRATTAN